MKTTQDLYSHKPPQINSVSDLITFFSGIPEDAWCILLRQMPLCQRRCALGHIEGAYGKEALLPHSVSEMMLALVNDGTASRFHLSPTPKARVLAYLHSLEPTSRPSPSVLNQVATLASVTTPCP